MEEQPGSAQRSKSKFIVFEQFEKLNTQSVRQALSEKELAWLENLQPIAPNNLTTVPAPAAALTNIAETITAQFFANLGTVDYIVSFTAVGSGWATNIASGASVRFAPPGTFTNPDATIWQSQYVLINDPTAGYSSWNGTVYVRKGGVSPLLTLTAAGSGYTSAPTVAITGGTGTGATAVATVGSPQVLSVAVIVPGSGYTTPPVVVFTGGGGSGAVAVASIDPRSITSITLTGQGGGYVSTPTIGFSGGGGSGAAATAVMGPDPNVQNRLRVIGINLTSIGAGYSSAPTVAFSGGSPTSAATATCTVGAGQVTGITVTAGGSNYSSAPAVSFTGGGGGSGVTAAATIGGSGVLTLVLTNPGAGYSFNDTLTVGFSGGGGSGATATAHVWPFVPAGTTLAVFAGRVWLGGGRLLQCTGTAGFDDFAAANASASLTIGDADLVHAITALRNFNNYLYIMGDQSVKQIGAISLNAAGNVTLFTILTLSSDQGTIYPRSCISFNRIFMFVNSNGVYAVFGSSVQKISDDLDGIFNLIDFTQAPQAAISDINHIHNVMFLVRYKDPLTSTRSIMLTFTGKKWFVVSQGDSIRTIVTASTLASGKTFPYASSGTDITNILADPTTAVAFIVRSALTHHGNAVQRKKVIRAGYAASILSSANIVMIIDTDNGSQTYTRALITIFHSVGSSVDGSGKYLGMTITGTLANFILNSMAIEYQEGPLWAGQSSQNIFQLDRSKLGGPDVLG
jgi:hypothetical protein